MAPQTKHKYHKKDDESELSLLSLNYELNVPWKDARKQTLHRPGRH